MKLFVTGVVRKFGGAIIKSCYEEAALRSYLKNINLRLLEAEKKTHSRISSF